MKKIIMTVFVIVAMFYAVANADDSYSKYTNTITYTVKPGDTMWDIASSHYDDDVDINRVIYEIKKENNMNDVSLSVGQTITLRQK